MKKSFALLVSVLMVAGVSVIGCSDEEESSGGSASPESVMSAIDNPTGTVDSPETAKAVGMAATEALSSGAAFGGGAPGGETYTEPCADSGDMTITADSQEMMDLAFNACCEEGCCYSGDGWVSVSAEAGATYAQCMSFDLSLTCDDPGRPDGDFSVGACVDGSGVQWVSVEVEGATYSVSGYYTEGQGGQWVIRSANGEWTCSETCTDVCTGTCTSDGGDVYEW